MEMIIVVNTHRVLVTHQLSHMDDFIWPPTVYKVTPAAVTNEP